MGAVPWVTGDLAQTKHPWRWPVNSIEAIKTMSYPGIPVTA
jgi:hypothetical protein